MTAPSAARPILVLGISRRSGTNFLAALLRCHADCVEPEAPLAEDHLLRHADLLAEYVDRTVAQWPARWGDSAAARAALDAHLADALVAFIADRGSGRVVSKTPSPDNLALLARLRPDADVVVLVRDGRSVVASLVSGFRWSFRKATIEWRRGARAILEFESLPEAERAQLRVRAVRFEAVVADPDDHIRALLEFVDLEPERYDWDRAHAMPVIGSSFVRDDSGRLTWEPVERASSFDPTARHERWSWRERSRFEWLAGSEQRALGYESPDAPGGVRPRGVKHRAYNLAADACAPFVHARDAVVGRALQWRGRRHRERTEAVGDD